MIDLNDRVQRLLQKVKSEPRQKWVLMMLLLGVTLYLMSGFLMEKEALPMPEAQTETESVQPALELRLEALLHKVNGVGKVEVLLTLAQEQSTVYQMDEQQNNSDTNQSIQRETVIVSGEGLVQTIYAPMYRGAVVVCEGGDRASVVQAVKAAVSSLTGLKNDEITVMKMK